MAVKWEFVKTRKAFLPLADYGAGEKGCYTASKTSEETRVFDWK